MKIKDRDKKLAAFLLLLRAGAADIKTKIRQYHARLYELGVQAGVEIGGQGPLLSSAEIIRQVDKIVEAQEAYADNWLGTDLAAKVGNAVNGDHASIEAAKAAVAVALLSQAFRARKFALAGHSTSQLGLASEMFLQNEILRAKKVRVEAIFTAFPEADVIETSCAGCNEAVAGNPYVPETVPHPGDFECQVNCRHEIWYRTLAEGEVPAD